MCEDEIIKLKLMSIDGWRDGRGWCWNNLFTLEDDIIFMSEDALTPRKVCRALRDWGYLTDYSKGRVRVDMHEEMMGGWMIEILDKGTGEPLMVLSNVHG